jgi:hypothetical protein
LSRPWRDAKKLYGSCQLKRTFFIVYFNFSFLSRVFNVLSFALIVTLFFIGLLVALLKNEIIENPE